MFLENSNENSCKALSLRISECFEPSFYVVWMLRYGQLTERCLAKKGKVAISLLPPFFTILGLWWPIKTDNVPFGPRFLACKLATVVSFKMKPVLSLFVYQKWFCATESTRNCESGENPFCRQKNLELFWGGLNPKNKNIRLLLISLLNFACFYFFELGPI